LSHNCHSTAFRFESRCDHSRLVGKEELMIDPAQEWQCENRASISPQLFLPGIIGRSIGFLSGEKENRERSPAENPPLQNTIVRN
jgi:hypothetical protein